MLKPVNQQGDAEGVTLRWGRWPPPEQRLFPMEVTVRQWTHSFDQSLAQPAQAALALIAVAKLAHAPR